MSSNESNSNNASPPAAPEGKPRSSVGLVALSLVLLAALVWAMAPARTRFEPAPLRPAPEGCPQSAPAFVPSDATEIPGADLSSLSQAQRRHVLFRLNMEPCPCGCNTSIAACRIGHPTCPLCKDLVEKIVAEESGARSQK
jgi:Na+-transporting methylmalonyl-CoA/oxaloacetate decarboxylase gamma subunit